MKKGERIYIIKKKKNNKKKQKKKQTQGSMVGNSCSLCRNEDR